MGKLRIEELDIAFISASTYQIGTPKDLFLLEMMHCRPLYFSEV